jgi:hypothetical protein
LIHPLCFFRQAWNALEPRRQSLDILETTSYWHGFRAANLVCNALVREKHAYVHLIPADEPDTTQTMHEFNNADTHSVHSDTTLPASNIVLDEEDLPPELNTFQLAATDDTHLIPDEDLLEEDPVVPTDQDLWAYWHHRLGHPPNLRVRAMARAGKLPRNLADCRIPLCPSCVFGKATRRPWRSKGQPTGLNKGETITSPGDCVSVDQLESPTQGLIGQIKGTLMRRRYQVTTVFVDHFSATLPLFVHHQQTTSGADTIEAKTAFEAFAASHGVTVRHYHADNGRFAEHKFPGSHAKQGTNPSHCVKLGRIFRMDLRRSA